MHHPSDDRDSRSPDRRGGAFDAGGRPVEEDRLFPWDTVVGVVDEPRQLDAAVNALGERGFAEGAIRVLCGREAARLIDPGGGEHGLLGRVFRVLDAYGEEHSQTKRHVEELREGHFLVVVEAADEDAKRRAHEALERNGAHFINHYTRWTTETLTP